MKKKFSHRTMHEKLGNISFWYAIHRQWRKLKSDYRIFGLWVIELLLAITLGISIALYVDPEINVLPFPWNYAAFLLILGIILGLHGFTRPFRVARRVNKAKQSV